MYLCLNVLLNIYSKTKEAFFRNEYLEGWTVGKRRELMEQILHSSPFSTCVRGTQEEERSASGGWRRKEIKSAS